MRGVQDGVRKGSGCWTEVKIVRLVSLLTVDSSANHPIIRGFLCPEPLFPWFAGPTRVYTCACMGAPVPSLLTWVYTCVNAVHVREHAGQTR